MERTENALETKLTCIELDERDKRIKEESWASLAARLPERDRESIIAGLKALYSLFTPDMIVWLANLYDPATGGFYCSNSARDNEGFLPDIESTYYALCFIEDLGAAEMFDNKWPLALPRWIKERAADWIYDLQDEDGYFYHPQWPKSYIQENKYFSRITRDYNTGRVLMRDFGRALKYPDEEPSEDKKSSKPNVLPQFASDEAFAEHLCKLEEQLVDITDARRAYKFYEYGNSFQSTVGFMSEKMKDMLEAFFDRHQNPENGLWSEGYHFDSTNGVHKIAAVYNYMGRELKHVDKMVESTMKILNFDPKTTPARYGVDIYNAWSAFPYIYKNIRNFSSGSEEERAEKCLAIKSRVFENAEAMIRITAENAAGFGYPDGSFGYARNTVGAGGTMQNCPCAIRGTKEGDLDGVSNIMIGLTNCIYGALELSDHIVPIYSERERVTYIKILEELDKKYREGKLKK